MELASHHVENIEVNLLVMRNQALSFQVAFLLENQIHLLTFQLMKAQMILKMMEFSFLQAHLILKLMEVYSM